MDSRHFSGSNNDQYTNQGEIWEIAKRHNNKTIELYGRVTVVRRKRVESVKRVGVSDIKD